MRKIKWGKRSFNKKERKRRYIRKIRIEGNLIKAIKTNHSMVKLRG
jgi:hypothetical protein